MILFNRSLVSACDIEDAERIPCLMCCTNIMDLSTFNCQFSPLGGAAGNLRRQFRYKE